MEQLREREAEVINRVATKMKDIEKYNFTARQNILKDMESVKAREEELDKLKELL
jgi:asparagine synthetase A